MKHLTGATCPHCGRPLVQPDGDDQRFCLAFPQCSYAAPPSAVAEDLARRLAVARQRYVERRAVPGQHAPLTFAGLIRLYRLILAEQTTCGSAPEPEGVPI